MELKDIKSPSDIKVLSVDGLYPLAAEIRAALLRKLSRHGGHIGPNLGMVEATIAMHYVFDSPEDKLVFDVSHQCYVHKMLTGRINAFIDPAHYDDVTGYTNPSESPHDFFTVGHTSTSVSLASGLAKARDLKGDRNNVIAIIGDGSLSGGESFEGLDYAATLGSNFIVVVNDNDMSIAENHGGLYWNLAALRETDGQCPVNYFKAMGFDYIYVSEGNDVRALVDTFRKVKDIDHPIVVHIATQKGKGFAPAEANREKWHFNAPFDIASGELLHVDPTADYGDVTADHLLAMMKQDPAVVAITAGTPGVIGFSPRKRKEAGKQFIDVGIAEQQAVALASGIAKAGGKPFFGVVSSFLQRTYDQLSQDLCINRNPAVIGVFYGTLYGMTDVTHLGFFDIALLSNIPELVYLAPTCKEEYIAMLDWAMVQTEHPVALRIPGTAVVETGETFDIDYSDLNRFKITRQGKDIAIIGAGSFYRLGLLAADRLKESDIHATVINPRYLTGIDTALLESLKADHTAVITLEDGILDGGFGEKIARFYSDSDMHVRCYGLPKEFLDRYDASKVAEECRLDPALIAEDAKALLSR